MILVLSACAPTWDQARTDLPPYETPAPSDCLQWADDLVDYGFIRVPSDLREPEEWFREAQIDNRCAAAVSGDLEVVVDPPYTGFYDDPQPFGRISAAGAQAVVTLHVGGNHWGHCESNLVLIDRGRDEVIDTLPLQAHLHP